CIDANLSPDQKSAVLDIVDFEIGGRGLWLLGLTRGGSTKLTLRGKPEGGPAWSPDGAPISLPSGPGWVSTDLDEKPSSGAGTNTALLHSSASKFPADWSQDGRFLLFEVRDPGAKVKLWALPLSDDRKPFPVLQTPFNETFGAFSPDGRWV